MGKPADHSNPALSSGSPSPSRYTTLPVRHGVARALLGGRDSVTATAPQASSRKNLVVGEGPPTSASLSPPFQGSPAQSGEA